MEKFFHSINILSITYVNSYKKLYSRYIINRNFSVNSKKNFIILAKCGVDNQQLKNPWAKGKFQAFDIN